MQKNALQSYYLIQINVKYGEAHILSHIAHTSRYREQYLSDCKIEDFLNKSVPLW